MAKGIRYTEEFKRDAVAQVKDRSYSVADVAGHWEADLMMFAKISNGWLVTSEQ